MRLTAFSDYCLRVLIYVGAKEDGLSTITEIAESYSVSRNHLMKVVYRLGQLGYLETVRGKNGGLRLARRPEDIRLGELIERTEEDWTLVECFQPGNRNCRIGPSCVLRGVLGEALAAFVATLNRYTLADLVAPRGELARLLDLPTTRQ